MKPDYENGFAGAEGAVMTRYESTDGRQGLVVSVYDDAIVYERRDFFYGRKLGPDWVQPLGQNGTFAFAPRKAKEEPPAFPVGADVSKSETTAKKRGKGRQKKAPAVTFSFPAANASSTRPLGYRITLVGDDKAKPLVRHVFAQGYNMPLEDKRAQGASYVTLAKSILPAGEKLAVSVEPFSSFGNFGKAIKAIV